MFLVSRSYTDLQYHLSALHGFLCKKELTIKLEKNKAMIFHKSTDSQISYRLSRGQIEEVDSSLYIGVTFTRIWMLLHNQPAKDQPTQEYAALAKLEWPCHQAHFQEPHTKVWLFDNMITLALMYSFDIENTPPFRYCTALQHDESNKILQQSLWKLYNQETGLTLRKPLTTKMAHKEVYNSRIISSSSFTAYDI